MTFKERYKIEETWHGKAMIMELYHFAMCQRVHGRWTISKTAEHFNCSIGLVSENLKLAHAFHSNPKLMESPNRQEALKRLNGHVQTTRYYSAEDEE
jgi:hypothetical protein